MMIKRLSAAVCAVLLLTVSMLLSLSAIDLRGVMDAMQYPENASELAEGKTPLQYRVYLPETIQKNTEAVGEDENGDPLRVTTYVNNAETTYGLLVWLHDEDLCGDDNTAQISDDTKNGLLNAFLNHPERSGQYIIIAPQCPTGRTWMDNDGELLDSVMFLMNHFFEKGLIDSNRILIGGISMGAEAGYALLEKVPVPAAFLIGGDCGNAYLDDPDLYMRTRIFAFCSDNDPLYPDQKITEMAQKINPDGGAVSLASYGGMGHDIWEQAFKEELFVSEFLDTNAPVVEPEPAVTEPVETEPEEIVTEAPVTEAQTEPEPVETDPVPQQKTQIGGIEITPALIAYVILAAACVIAVIMLVSGLIRHNRT